jgi:hypothetical protein
MESGFAIASPQSLIQPGRQIAVALFLIVPILEQGGFDDGLQTGV